MRDIRFQQELTSSRSSSIDNSEFMRNGDFPPTRLQSQQDAVHLLCHAKSRANPENNLGLLTLATNEVLTTLTSDRDRLMRKLRAIEPQGNLQLISGLRIAHLVLKHRQGKNHKMRIVCFIGKLCSIYDFRHVFHKIPEVKDQSLIKTFVA